MAILRTLTMIAALASILCLPGCIVEDDYPNDDVDIHVDPPEDKDVIVNPPTTTTTTTTGGETTGP